MTCCEHVDDEDLRREPELYDCDTCLVRIAVEELAPENGEAWNMFHHLAQRFLVDTHLTAKAFEALTADWDAERILDLLERLGIIYDIVMPPPSRTP